MSNDWNLGDATGYSQDNFYCHLTKDSVSRSARIRQSESRLIDIICAQRRYPDIETSADFIRDAIHHRLVYLSQYNKEEIDILRLERRMHDDTAWKLRQISLDDALQQKIELIILLRSKGHLVEADRELNSTVADIEGLSESYWKSRWVERLQSYFGMQIWGDYSE